MPTNGSGMMDGGTEDRANKLAWTPPQLTRLDRIADATEAGSVPGMEGATYHTAFNPPTTTSSVIFYSS